jgi:hypothetical protein
MTVLAISFTNQAVKKQQKAVVPPPVSLQNLSHTISTCYNMLCVSILL